jgi:hypothetical protein
MKHLYQIVAFVFLLIPQLTNAQAVVQLFNGNNLSGWYAFEPEEGKRADASGLFVVEDHMIRLYGNKAGYLMSDEVFKDFKLTVEFRWNMDTAFVRKSNNRNSGVMYLVPADTPDELWPRGIQFQIKDGAIGDFILLQGATLEVNGKRTEAGKSIVVNHSKDAARPAGEWNTMVVTVVRGHIKQELNGKLVNEGKKPSVSEGRILLQYEGFPIDFRKVEIQRFPERK